MKNESKVGIFFLPLGGAEQIGMNLNAYILRYQNGAHIEEKILLVDCGAGFPDNNTPGANLIVPDISFLIENKHKIIGLIITHIHEDHIGGVQYLWEDLECKIYATKFTADFLRLKLSDAKYNIDDIPINEITGDSNIQLEQFDIMFLTLNHSAPEMQALFIRTPFGNIFHTGDWKFDHNPVLGAPNDEKLLSKCGKEGVLAVVGDSTKIFSDGCSDSEGDLADSLYNIIKDIRGLVVITTFASNVARIDSVAKIAIKLDRKIVVMGKSFWRIIKAANQSGYLTDYEFINAKDIKKYNRESLLVLSTGCQGEYMAAIAKLSKDVHPDLKLVPNDTVIFSSKIIPGNEKEISTTYNNLIKKNVNVITELDKFVHVSGHPPRGDLKKMYNLLQPKIVIPVHGELIYTCKHADFAKELGIKYAITVKNGTELLLSNNEVYGKIIRHIPSGYIAIDGNCLLDCESAIFKTRCRMRDHGIIFVALIVNKAMRLVTDPIINYPGVLDGDADKDIDHMVRSEITKIIKFNARGNGNNKDSSLEDLSKRVKDAIKRLIKRTIGKFVTVTVNIRKL